MNSCSDFVERMLLRPETLTRLKVTDPDDTESILRIRAATDSDLAGEAQVKSRDHLHMVRAALFYLFDALDDAHPMVQESNLDIAGYLHGMIHRREGDFENARYWFRRTGTLPFFAAIHSKSAALSADFGKQLGWDPYLFTHHCEQHRFGADEETTTLLRIQRAEFDTLLEYTWRQSVDAHGL